MMENLPEIIPVSPVITRNEVAFEWNHEEAKKCLEEVTEKAEMTVRICARCHRPIPRGEEMVEKIGGWYVTTHLECRRGAEYTPRKKDLDAMIRDALRGGPGDQLRRKEMAR